MSAKKSIHNVCPVCGKPRGIGMYEFAHGKCAEVRAATDGKKIYQGKHPRPGSTLTVEQHEKAVHRSRAKKYLSGKLPDWMIDR